METIPQRKWATLQILTDHKNLIRFTTTKELTDGQIRWSEVLSGFDFKIEFRPGKEGGKPDALTRRKADMPQEGDERLTQKERILLPQKNTSTPGSTKWRQ